MSDKRIINFEDGNGSPPPKAPTTMAELLTAAEAAWKAGEKQKAFITALGAMAMMSQGVATAMKAAELAHREVKELKAKLPSDPKE